MKKWKFATKLFLCGWALLALALVLPSQAGASRSGAAKTVGIAWRNNQGMESYRRYCRSVEAAGGQAHILEQVRSYDVSYEGDSVAPQCLGENGILLPEYAKLVRVNSYQNSNVAEVMRGVRAVVFSGGEDICPSLYSEPKLWHGLASEGRYNAARDISDYLLMAYCLDNDIAVLGICRGMQMLGVVSGAAMIQDIPSYYKERGAVYNDEHRSPLPAPGIKREYAAHDMKIVERSGWLYGMMGSELVRGVPTWHHQAIANVAGTRLRVKALWESAGVEIVEAVERPDKKFVVGVQFHPEVAVVRHLDKQNGHEKYMDLDLALAPFRALIKHTDNSCLCRCK